MVISVMTIFCQILRIFISKYNCISYFNNYMKHSEHKPEVIEINPDNALIHAHKLYIKCYMHRAYIYIWRCKPQIPTNRHKMAICSIWCCQEVIWDGLLVSSYPHFRNNWVTLSRCQYIGVWVAYERFGLMATYCSINNSKHRAYILVGW